MLKKNKRNQWQAGEGRTISLETRDPEQLSEDPSNAKVHTNEQVEHVIASIQEFGFNDPIGIRPDGMVVEGHARLEACKRLGLEEVPVFVLQGFTDSQLALYAVAHNKLTLQTRMNSEMVAEMLSRAYTGDETFDWSDLGIKDSEMGLDPEVDAVATTTKADGTEERDYSKHRGQVIPDAVPEYEIVFTPDEHREFGGYTKNILTDANKHSPLGDRVVMDLTANIDRAIQEA